MFRRLASGLQRVLLRNRRRPDGRACRVGLEAARRDIRGKGRCVEGDAALLRRRRNQRWKIGGVQEAGGHFGGRLMGTVSMSAWRLNPQTRLRRASSGGAAFLPETVTTLELDE